MKVWVTGASGALGREVVVRAKARGHEVLGTTHLECPVESLASVGTILQHFQPDCIVNCAGVLPGATAVDSIVVNALGPSSLASFGVRMVHMSTDGVFAGDRQGWLKSTDRPDPVDVYGRTKLAGEIVADNVLNVRGSFLSRHSGFLGWLLGSSGPVEAWEKAYWNGTTSLVMADALLTLAEGEAVGVLHVSSPEYVSKADLVEYFVEQLSLPVQFRKVRQPEIWRVLEPGYELPDLWQCMANLAAELREA